MKRIVEEGDGGQSGVARPASDDPRKYDSLSRRGAAELAKRLQEYWHGCGYSAARFWTEPVVERFGKLGTHEIHCVRCNFVDGLPPRYERDVGPREAAKQRQASL